MKRVICIFNILFMIMAFPVNAMAADYDSSIVYIDHSGAPDTAYYADILIKLDETDPAYSDFNTPSQIIGRDREGNDLYTTMNITGDSEIARYNEDGYVSLTLHTGFVRALTVNKSGDDSYFNGYDEELLLVRDGGAEMDGIHKKYGDFKLAYVDSFGNVLSVIGPSSTQNRREPYAFKANGGRLTYVSSGIHINKTAAALLLFWPFILVLAVLLILTIATILVTRRLARRTKAYPDFLLHAFDDKNDPGGD